jgi:small-conductance mechanosensitive channel
MLSYELFGNSIQKWAIAAATMAVTFIIARQVISIVLKRVSVIAPKTDTILDDLMVAALNRVHWLFLLIVSIYIGAQLLTLPALAVSVIFKLCFVSILLQTGILGSRLLHTAFDIYRQKRIDKNAEAVTTLSSVAFLLRILLWILLFLVALDNFGADVTTLIAGLGVGGIALALAVQNILGDLFASFSIVLDKPFIIGDFIIVGDYMGTVEYIGLKTTRLRSISGEQLIFSNADLLGSRIRNYKRMYERRVVFSVAVVYRTAEEKLVAIPEIIREIVQAQAQVRFDRAHFKDFGAYALNFEIVYWVHSPDYNLYMDIQQAINLSIFRRFNQAGIAFAYPSQTLFLDRPETGGASANGPQESGPQEGGSQEDGSQPKPVGAAG